MSRLVMVSNRVADLSQSSQWGGLAVALSDALKACGGIWFGWDGTVGPRAASAAPRITTAGNVMTVTVPLERRDYNQYYVGYANSVLWPVFHYRLDQMDFKRSFLSGYRRVNSRFAAIVSGMLEQDDTIWVHDYHLIPLAAELRRRGHRNRIGFFLHIPFPSPEIFSATPGYLRLVEDLLSYDLVGFQTSTDLGNFQKVLSQEVGAGGNPRVVKFDSQVTCLGSFPIGIDVDAFQEAARANESAPTVRGLKRQTEPYSRVLGIDRLDYSKGLPERLTSFRQMLRKHPEMYKHVTLIQIAPPTRENVDAYTNIREVLEQLSGAINGEFADIDWTPVRYIHRVVPRNILGALSRTSRVGFVTPLRDGMNLVAKEYVAAQDSRDPGVLVLSKFAGAAEELDEALLVNPHDGDEMADALYRALRMPLNERVERQKALLARIRGNDANNWRESFLRSLAGT